MTVQDRCGQCNELPPVMQFLSANKWGEVYSACLLADKAVQKRRIALMESKVNRKKFVRYKEGAELYSICQSKFEKLAKEAKAIYKVDKVVLVNCELFEKYLETFRIDG